MRRGIPLLLRQCRSEFAGVNPGRHAAANGSDAKISLRRSAAPPGHASGWAKLSFRMHDSHGTPSQQRTVTVGPATRRRLDQGFRRTPAELSFWLRTYLPYFSVSLLTERNRRAALSPRQTLSPRAAGEADTWRRPDWKLMKHYAGVHRNHSARTWTASASGRRDFDQPPTATPTLLAGRRHSHKQPDPRSPQAAEQHGQRHA